MKEGGGRKMKEGEGRKVKEVSKEAERRCRVIKAGVDEER
jgi:hypothetical protein